MKRSSVKAAFGGEVKFTKFISEDKPTSDRLLESIDMDLGDYNVVAEDRTLDGKRADLVVREGETVMAVIEAQDASGWLDSVHASKIAYYMYEKGCNTGVLVCEDADEHLKGFVRHLNENTPFNIYLIAAMVFDNKHIEFTPLMRPFSLLEKRVSRRVISNSTPNNGVSPNAKANAEWSEWAAEYVNAKREENPGLFNPGSTSYLAKGKLGKNNYSMAINLRKSGEHMVDLYSRNKDDMCPELETKFVKFAESIGKVMFSKTSRAYRVKCEDWVDTLDVFKKMMAAQERGELG